MTWNVLEGGEDPECGRRHDRIEAVLGGEDPHVLVLCEASDVSGGRLADACRAVGLRGVSTRAADEGFNIAVLVQPLVELVSFEELPSAGRTPLAACVLALPSVGEVRLVAAHLEARDAAVREEQARQVVEWIGHAGRRVVMGDLNALSPEDRLDLAALGRLPANHLPRHLNPDGTVATGALRVLLEEAGLVDAWQRAGGRDGDVGTTVPTDVPQPPRFGPMRLDYILVSRELAPLVQSCRVVRGVAAASASDHHAVVAELADG